MANTGPTTLSLFSGVGGLDLGWTAAAGGRMVGYAERDAYAASVLLARMEEQSLESAPVWCGDITQLPLAPFHGVDAIIGGFPCQDISQAGAGAGIEGERSGFWGRAFVPAIRELRPRIVFVENVSALLARGLADVLGDLASLGYDTEWLSLRASDVGAPHRRERVFILGYTASTRRRGHALGGFQQEIVSVQLDAAKTDSAMGDPDLARQQRCGPAEPTGRIFPPGPDRADEWRAIIADQPWLAPALEPGLRVVVDGASLVVDQSRADALRCAGNGVVPLQAAVAARALLRCY